MRLSLCLCTYNRCAFIAQTLETIVPQLTAGVELIIVDGASPDETEQVVRPFLARHENIRYVREAVNSGIDADYDKSVGYARGEHCWLIADDDLLAPDAVARVLSALADGDPDLVVVDAEVRDVTLGTVLDGRRFNFSGERNYGPADRDAFLADAGNALSFIGCVIIRRAVWMQRERQAYYGTLFVHVGVIFQAPAIERIKVLGAPLVIIRLGNAMWSARSFEIWMFKWPDLIWGFEGYGEAAKNAVVPRSPWKLPLRMLLYRANGAFGLQEYRRFFAERRAGHGRILLIAAALMPGRLANLLAALLLSARGLGRGSGAYNLLTCSPYASGLSRAVVRAIARPSWLPGRKRA